MSPPHVRDILFDVRVEEQQIAQHGQRWHLRNLTLDLTGAHEASARSARMHLCVRVD